MRGFTIVAATAVAVLLSGCGGGDGGNSGAPSSPPSPADNGESKKTGPVVASDAAAALEAAGAVHAKGTITTDGKPGQMDIQMQGNDAAGSLTMAGEKVGIVVVGGKAYFNAPTSFWRANGAPAGAAPRFGNRWVIMPKADADSFAGDVSIKKFADEIRHPTDGAIQPQVNLGQEAGQPVVILSQPSGSTLSVAATGQPYPLHETDKGKEPGDIVLSAFGQRQNITAPPDAVDLEQLSRG